ncbi:Trm112 family protein [Sphingobium estronivorans]|uniref:Trm112 family protein n=1 Tax=Sphingobium estronivorans TaxID=1577690 RepID=UPI001239DE69|nr:Trm112 family protein [Sphingobium estronivorans]
MTQGLDPALLAKLACPVTRTPLRWDAERGELVSEAAGLAFPVRDGVPVLVVREARVIAET